MSEKNAYKTFYDGIKQFGPRDRIERIENGVGVGAPDINFCIEAKEGWLELKSPKEPLRATTPLFGSNHRVSQDQKNWFLRQYQAGGFCAFLIMTDKRWMLVPGRHADNLNNMTVSNLIKVAVWTTARPIKEKRQWELLRANLITLR